MGGGKGTVVDFLAQVTVKRLSLCNNEYAVHTEI